MISPVLIGHVKHLYSMAMDEIARRDGPQSQASASQSEGPLWTPLAIPAYILATAAVEAFVNEVFLSRFGQLALGRSPGEAGNLMLSGADKSLEKLDLPTKLIEVPLVALGRSLDPGKQPHQDMTWLAQLRIVVRRFFLLAHTHPTRLPSDGDGSYEPGYHRYNCPTFTLFSRTGIV
jgi:hypothetical protein